MSDWHDIEATEPAESDVEVVLLELDEHFAKYEPQPGDFCVHDVRKLHLDWPYDRLNNWFVKRRQAGLIEKVGRVGTMDYYRKVEK